MNVSSQDRKRILVVCEDGERIADVLEVLQGTGFSWDCQPAVDAARGLDDGERRDLLIVVIEPPALAGIEACRAYRRLLGDAAPILALSDAFKREHIEGMLENLGIRRLLPVAVRGDELLFWINHALFPESLRSRKSPRLPARFILAIGNESRPVRARASNLSEDGLFLETAQAVAEGEVIEVRFRLPGRGTGRDAIVANGRVVWSNPVRSEDADLGPYGVGLRFIDLDSKSRRSIKAWVMSGLLDSAI